MNGDAVRRDSRRIGLISTAVIVVVSLVIAALLDPGTFAGPVATFVLCHLPVQIVLAGMWVHHTDRLTGTTQPARGAILLVAALVVGAVAELVFLATVGAGRGPSTPQIAMFTITVVVATFWLAVVLEGWPFARIHNGFVATAALLLTVYVVALVLFYVLFDFSFLPPPAQTPQTPSGVFNAWYALVFLVTAISGMFLPPAFGFLGLDRLNQPVRGFAATALCLIWAAVLFGIGVGALRADRGRQRCGGAAGDLTAPEPGGGVMRGAGTLDDVRRRFPPAGQGMARLHTFRDKEGREVTGAEQSDRARRRVVVVGGGFAGLAAVRELRKADVDVLLLDRDPYTTFQPLLYQVATGALNPGDITYALRSFAGRLPNVRFRRACVTGLDPQNRHVRLDDGTEVAYDYLILACGVTANFFGIPGAEEHARTTYTRGEALGVRDRMFGNLEAYAQGREGAVEPVVVVVGGGPTGVEMAGAMAELRNEALEAAYPEVDPQRARVVLVEMTDKVLGPFDPKLREYAAAALRERGVELRLGVAVKEVRPDCVLLADGERLPAAATVWATGVKVDSGTSGWGLPQGRGGRIRTGPDLRVEGHPEIFAVGDVAGDRDEPLPQLARPAIDGGRHAGRQIRRLRAGLPTRKFVYRNLGIAATIGRADAVIQLPLHADLRGLVAWLGWVALHVVLLMGGRNRLATLTNLTVRYVAWRHAPNVIVGDPR